MLRRWRTLMFLLLVLLQAAPALAFQLTPISQVLTPSGPGSKVTYEVRNRGAEPIAVDISVFAYRMDLDGREDFSVRADDEFLVHPAQFVLEPGGLQTVRLSWLGTAAPKQELLYRFVAEQVPVDLTAGDPARAPVPTGRISLNYRYIGTVSIRPPGVDAAVSVESAVHSRSDDGKDALVLVLHNSGDARARLKKLRLVVGVGDDARQLTDAELEPIRNTSVLPGSRRRYVLRWPERMPVGAPAVALTLP